jgi:hypothetical protein
MRFSIKLLTPILAGFLWAFPPAVAQDQGSDRDGYMPSVGDVMTIIQLRHAKVWYAAKLKNWPLAAYELDKLEDSLAQVTRLRPDLSGTGDGMLPIDGVSQAIARMDESTFDTAFDAMTDACNACHVAADLDFIAIRPPTRFSPYSNQVFEPR